MKALDSAPSTRHILLSVVSKQARKILAGTKHWEFRNNLPRTASDEQLHVTLYSSQEDKAVIGQFVVGRILRTSFDELMHTTGYSQDPEALAWFRKYYEGRIVCSALEVLQPTPLPEPLSLADIREHIPDFRPPQNFIYLSETHPLLHLIDTRGTYNA